MRTFAGFLANMRAIRLPETLFTELLPAIDDLDELKLTLHVLYLLNNQAGEVRYVRHRDLLTDQLLSQGLSREGGAVVEESLRHAVERGTLLQWRVKEQGEAGQSAPSEVVYFANTPRGRAALEALRRGEPLPEITPLPRPDIFVLYEENIGPLSPLIADELQEAEKLYPADWIEDAFREAAALNKRSWRYVNAILTRWHSQGRKDETSRRDHERDRRRYIEGKYGEYIKH